MSREMTIMNRGMNSLLKVLGEVDTERFISMINRERLDYTQWRRKFYDSQTNEEIKQDIERYVKENPGRSIGVGDFGQ